MFCPKCGANVESGSGFCPMCGNTFAQEAVVAPTPKKKKTGLVIVLVAVGVVLALMIGLVLVSVIGVAVGIGVWNSGKEELQDQLLRDWERVEQSDGSYYTLELDFSYGECDYNFDGSIIDSKISTFDYEVIAPNKIEIDGREITIEFNDDKTMMIMTPALTRVGDKEYWYHF